MESKTIKLLLLEDEPAHAEAIRRALKSSSGHFQVRLVGTVREYHESVAAGSPDIALLDMILPDGGALELLPLPPLSSPFPLIVMTSHGDEQTAVAAMKAGALDYIVKSPDSFADMPRIVTRTLEHWQMLQESRQAQQALKESEEKYRLIIENSRDIIYTQDIRGKILFASPSVKGVLGYDPAELVGRPFQSFIHPEDIAACEEAVGKVIELGEQTLGFEYRVKDSSGDWRWLASSAVRVLDADGSFLYFLGIGKDITVRKQAGQLLRESEEKYRSLVENINDVFYTLDSRGNITYVSPVVERLSKYKADDLIGEPFTSLIYPDDLPGLLDSFNRLVAGKLEPWEFRIVDVDGRIIFVRTSSNPLYENGEIVGITALMTDITGRKQAEAALHESEAQYRLLADHMTDTVWLMDMDLKITYQSLSVLKLRGFTPGEVMALPLDKQVTPASFKLANEVFIEELLKMAAEPGYNTVRTLELEYYRKDGSTLWAENTFSIMRDGDGRPASILGEGRDITERKQAQDLQRISEERYRSVVENASEVIIVAQDSVVKFANRKMEEISGYSREELLSVAFIEFVHPDDRQFLVESEFRKLRGDKFVAAHPVRLIDKGGQVIWMEISAVVINWEGRPATLNFVSDITERKHAEDALQESEEKYRNLVELLHEGIWAIDEDARTTYVNAHMAEMLGYTVEEMQGKELFSFMDERGRELAAQNIERRRDGISETHDFEFLRKDGARIYASLATTPVTGQDGTYRGAIAGVQDITDRRRLEEERQRVAKLESVGLLAAGIAHDFNNILTAILGNISLAGMEAAPGSELQNSLAQAEKASLRAKDLTVQLLTFSKGGAPVKKLTPLMDLLKDTAGFALRGSNVKCKFYIPDDLWQAEIDEGQISQVIHNLVVNAQQSMPSGGTIELRAGNTMLNDKQNIGRGLPVTGGDYVRIAVTDHGTGIPRDHLEKIFDPFFTTRQKGSGLGLAVSFSIARQHGGHISVESEPGRGSSFYLYLPASTQTAAPKPAKAVAGKPTGKDRILVMDDEQGVRDIAGRMLKHLGYADIEFAADGAAAIKVYKAAMKSGRPFTVAMLDLTIAGGMGGEETIKKLLKIDPGVRAIVSSGYADDPVMAAYRSYGFSGVAAKPYTLDQLRKALQDVTG